MFRNNSAWNYRYFIVENLSGTFKDKEIVSREIEFAKQAIKKLSCNESSWCYLNGSVTFILLNVNSVPFRLLVNDGIAAHPEILEFCQSLHKGQETRSTHLRCLLFDYYNELVEKSIETKANSESAFKLLDELEDVDPIRKSYYNYLRERISNLLSEGTS
jgi:hypothetical protein